MIVLTVELRQLRLKVGADAGKYFLQIIEYGFGEHATAVFRYEDQMHMHHKYTMSSAANLVVAFFHRPDHNAIMVRLQAFKYELRPNSEQQRTMRRFAGSCRFVFNQALALQRKRYDQGEKKLGYAELCRELTAWRNSADTPWLADAPVHPLQQTLKDLERAYKNFFSKRASFPRFKKKGTSESFRYPDPKQFKIDAANSRIFLPKLGWMRYRNSRDMLGAAKNITVACSGGKWFASIQTEREIAAPVHNSTSAIGIDVGIVRFATMSDGSAIAPLNSVKRHEQRLARYQRAMSRKVKFSANWKKAKSKVQRVHAKVAACRRDFLHKASASLAQAHALICVEDLQVRNMSRSAAGTVAAPGRNVKAKSGLNKSILDQGWSEFRRQLDYKSQWCGGQLIAVAPQYTSQTCPSCGHIAKDNRQSQALFLCVACGHTQHADHVGAINILERGHRLLACGESVQLGRSVKQEPPEATTQRSHHAIPA